MMETPEHHAYSLPTLLRALGIGRQYLGYGITIEAVSMVLRDENRLFCVKHDIFQPLADKQHCDWRTIERNIRTVINRAWNINQQLIIEMAGYQLRREPTVTEFIEMLASYMMRQGISHSSYNYHTPRHG